MEIFSGDIERAEKKNRENKVGKKKDSRWFNYGDLSGDICHR